MFLATSSGTDYTSSWLIVIAGALILSALYWGAVCGFVAREKGRDEIGWCIAGLVSGLIGLGFLAFLPLHAAPALEDD